MPASASARLAPLSSAAGLDALERTKEVGSCDHADELVVAEQRDAAVLGGRDERLELGERRVLGRGRRRDRS